MERRSLRVSFTDLTSFVEWFNDRTVSMVLAAMIGIGLGLLSGAGDA